MLNVQTLIDRLSEMRVEPRELELTRNEYRILVARAAEIAGEDGDEEEEE